jgi:hypothetical protein
MAEQIVTETQFIREDPRLEEIKLGLLGEAAKLAYRPEFGGQLPEYQVASFSPAQRAALQAGMDQGIGSYLPYIEAGNVALGQGLGATQVGQIAAAGAAGTYDPRSAVAFMNPYQQAVTEQSLRDIRRQADIAGQGQAAQAVRSGAYGGTREGVQRAEMERNTQNLDGAADCSSKCTKLCSSSTSCHANRRGCTSTSTGNRKLYGQLGQELGRFGVSNRHL